jgi:hypothetical protein
MGMVFVSPIFREQYSEIIFFEYEALKIKKPVITRRNE